MQYYWDDLKHLEPLGTVKGPAGEPLRQYWDAKAERVVEVNPNQTMYRVFPKGTPSNHKNDPRVGTGWRPLV